MTCQQAAALLVAFQFGALADDERAQLEAHLLGCPPCVRAFLELKRAIELPEQDAGPSPQARLRLRRAVLAQISPTQRAEPWRWWERPLAFALAGTAVFLATVSVGVLTGGPGAPPHGLLDLPSQRSAH
jgi:anti-sigma factor RsiW